MEDEDQTTFNSHRPTGIAIILIQLVLIIAYAATNSDYQSSASHLSNLEQISFIVMMTIFTIVGFGLLLSSYGHAAWLGPFAALLTLGIGMQLNPLLQKLWFKALIEGMNDVPSTAVDFMDAYNNDKIVLHYNQMETGLLACVGCLLVQTAVVGRISLSQLLRLICVYFITWNLNYFLCVMVNAKFAPQPGIVFDGYGCSFLYLFSSAFAVIFVKLLPHKIGPQHPRYQMSKTSMIFGLMGTSFIICTFVFAYAHYLKYSSKSNNIAGLNIMLSLSGSIVGVFVGSYVLGKGKIGIRDVLMGSMSGGVMIASVAHILDNIGIIIMLGIISGFLSGLYIQKIHPKINRYEVYDSLGLSGPILINAMLGSFVVGPAVLNAGTFTKDIMDIEGVSSEMVKFQLVYGTISLSLGLVCGFVGGLVCVCDEDKFSLFANSRYFRRYYSLYHHVPKLSTEPSQKQMKQDEV